MDPQKFKVTTTTDGQPADPGLENAPAPRPIDPATGQHKAYWVLSEDERKKGFIRPVRDAYRHQFCGAVTLMGRALAETYARDPSYYGATFCAHCRDHFPVGEHGQFLWCEDGTKVAT